MGRRNSAQARKWCTLALAIGTVSWPRDGFALSNIIVSGGNHYRAFTSSDLTSGPGSNFTTPVTIGTTFTITVSSDGPCEVWVQRSSGGWLTTGTVWVQIKTGNVFGDPIPVEVAGHKILSSATPLTNQPFELRYLLENVTVGNTPGSYSTVVTYSVNDA